MPCGSEGYYEDNYEDEVALAERGLNADEIADLQARATLAREQAKMDSYNLGQSLTEQQEKVQAAISAAVAEWHLDQHAKLEGVMKQITIISHAHAPVETG